MRKTFKAKLRSVYLRCSLNLLLQQIGFVIAVAGILALMVVLCEKLFAVKVIYPWVLWTYAGCTTAAALILWLLKLPSRMRVALLMDERVKIQERFSTTLAFADSDDPFAKAACVEAKRTVESINIRKQFPVKPTKLWFCTAGTWLLVIALVLFMPQKDLFGFSKKAKEEQQKTKEVELAKKTIDQTTKNVKMVVQQLDDPNLNNALAELAKTPDGLTPQNCKRDTINKLGSLSDRIKKMQSKQNLGSMQMLQQMMKKLKMSPQNLSQQLSQSLAKGDFQKAADLLRQFQKQLAEGQMSEESKTLLSKQMQNLANQLEKLAQETGLLQKELEKMGLDKKLANLNQKQLEQALKQMQLSEQQIKDLLQKAGACRSANNRCSALGEAMGACGGAGGGINPGDLENLIKNLQAMDSFQQSAKLSQAALSQIEQAIQCLGEGMCQGSGQNPFSKGQSNKFSMGTGGPGKGFGQRETDEDGETTAKSTRVEGKDKGGPPVASWYIKGTHPTGEAKRDFAEVVRASRDNAAEAISENQIPRKYEESLKKYFGDLEDTANK